MRKQGTRSQCKGKNTMMRKKVTMKKHIQIDKIFGVAHAGESSVKQMIAIDSGALAGLVNCLLGANKVCLSHISKVLVTLSKTKDNLIKLKIGLASPRGPFHS